MYSYDYKDSIYLHGHGDTVPVTQDLMKILGTKDISQGGLSQKSVTVISHALLTYDSSKPCGVMSIFHICHTHHSIWYSVVDHRIHGHRDRVLGQDLGGERGALNSDKMVGYELPTSCGGTPRVIVLKSTFWYDSIQGNTKNIPEGKSRVREFLNV